MRFLLLAVIVMLAALALGIMYPDKAKAQSPQVAIITAIDVSGSVDTTELDFEAAGMAAGITNENFVATFPVFFEVFTWQAGGDFRAIVPRTVLRTGADAAAAAQLLPGLRFARNGMPQYPAPSSLPITSNLGNTALGEAMLYALHRASSISAQRIIINVVADSENNSGIHPSVARDLAASRGITINAVIFGEAYNRELYFRNHVVTGPGAFVEAALTPDDLQDILARKFWQDMVAGLMQ